MTTIQFIGLIILTNLTTSGAHLVIGTVPGIIPTHDAIIAYRPSDLVEATNWPKAGSLVFAGVEYDYVQMDRENITFSGPSDPFVKELVDLPHLSCCCGKIERLRAEYSDLNERPETKAAAHVILDRGTFRSYEVPESNGALGTTLTFTEEVNLTIEGRLGTNAPRKLLLKPGASVLMSNTPFLALEHPQEAHNHFLAFYNMGVGAATCTRQPGDDVPQCFATPPECTPVAGAKARRKPRPPATTAMPPRQRTAPQKLLPILVVDINCSGSQWP